MIVLLIVGVILLLFLWYVLKPRPKDENGFKMWFFNEKSWHARYYKWVVSDTLPQGGCSYFWSIIALVLFSELIFFFWFLVFIVGLFSFERKKIERTPEEWDAYYARQRKCENRKEKLAIVTGKIFVGFIAAVLLGLIIWGILNAKGGDWVKLLIILGIIAGAVGVIILLRWVWLKLKLGNQLLKIIKPLGYPFRYIWSMIVAIYTNSCPKITWHK